MNQYTLNIDTYILPNGQLNFPNYQANLQLFVATAWQRSKKENAEGLKFFASIWDSPKLVHRGVNESVKPAQEEKKKTSAKK